MKRTLAFLLLLLACISLLSSADDDKIKIAVTFDDLPIVGRHLGIEAINETTDTLLNTLMRHKIRSVGFINERKLYTNGEFDARREILEKWLAAGQELGNHTYSHPNYHNVDFETYSADIIKGEKVLGELLAKNGDKIAWFRHPMLRNGNTPEKKASLRTFLKDRGYTVSPVTIENDDYIYAAVHSWAVENKDIETQTMVEKEYLDFTEKMFIYFEKASMTLFGRQIDHVLLLHSNQLNAICFERMCQMMLKRGYEFSTMAEVLKDEAYKSPDNWTGNAGTNWLFRWDYSLNDPKKVNWREQPVPSEKIMKKYRQILSNR